LKNLAGRVGENLKMAKLLAKELSNGLIISVENPKCFRKQ
jgi:hypothetical protein